MSSENNNQRYSDDYREQCFQAWYAAGRPSKLSKITEIIPANAEGQRPNRNMLTKWLNEGWLFRADELDARAIQVADDALIVKKAEMLQEQAKRGERLQQLGMEYLEDKKFDSASAAVQAVIRGADLERSSRGIGELIIKMSKMTDGDLKDEIYKRLQILSEDAPVDADVKEEESDEPAG